MALSNDTLSIDPEEPICIEADVLRPPYTKECAAPIGLTGDGTFELGTEDLAATQFEADGFTGTKMSYYGLTRTVGGTDPYVYVQFRYRLSGDLYRGQQYFHDRIINSIKIKAGRSATTAGNKVYVTLYDTEGVVNPDINNKELVFASSSVYEEFELTPASNAAFVEAPAYKSFGGTFVPGGIITVRIKLALGNNVGDIVRVSDIVLDIG